MEELQDIYACLLTFYQWQFLAGGWWLKVFFKCKVQNELGILFAVQTHLLNGWVCFESTNFVSSIKKVGLTKAICRSPQLVLCDPPYQSAVCLMNCFLWDQSSDKLIIFLDLTLDSRNSRIDSQASRLDSWKFWDSRTESRESRREWLSTYFWGVLYVSPLSCLFRLIFAYRTLYITYSLYY